MMARLLVCVCLVIAVFLAELSCTQTQEEQDTCRFQYQEEPSSTSETQCNIFGSTVSFVCRVSGEEPFDIQWHFTNDSKQAGNVNLISVDYYSSIYSFSVSPLMIVNNRHIWEYHMSILIVDQGSIGYYWCSVLPKRQMVFPNPSRVVYIAEQCSVQGLDPCPVDPGVSLHRSTDGNHCATTARNVSIVAAQDIDCSLSTTNLATAEATTIAITAKPTSPKSTTTDSPPKETKTNVSPDSFTTQKVTTQKLTTGVTGLVSSPKPKSTTLASTDSMETEFSTSTTVVLTNTSGSTQEMMSENEGSSPEDNQNMEVETEVVWLSIGVVLAVLLTAVFVLLFAITCVQCRKMRLKGQPVSSHRSHTETELGLQERRPAIETNTIDDTKTEITIQEPDYEEIPANILRVDSLRPSASPQTPKLEDNSSHYEDFPTPVETECCSPRNHYETLICEEDPPDYSCLDHNGFNIPNPSKPIAPALPQPSQDRPLHSGSGQGDFVFDDPKYDLADDFLSPHAKPPVKVVKSTPANANVKEGSSGLDREIYSKPRKPVIFDNEDYQFPNTNSLGQQPPSAQTIARRESYDASNAHVYTPIKPYRPDHNSDYTIPIVTTNEKYVSEQGHLYHILETGDADKKIINQSADIPDRGTGLKLAARVL